MPPTSTNDELRDRRRQTVADAVVASYIHAISDRHRDETPRAAASAESSGD